MTIKINMKYDSKYINYYLKVWRCSSVADAFSNWLNVLMESKFWVMASETAIPEIPVSKIAVTSSVVMPPKPITGVSVFKASIMAV